METRRIFSGNPTCPVPERRDSRPGHEDLLFGITVRFWSPVGTDREREREGERERVESCR